MKNLITHNPIVNCFEYIIGLVIYIRHCYYMEQYLKDWAAVEGKTLEQFKKETFESGLEAYQNFLKKFDVNDYERFKRENSVLRRIINS